MFWPTSEPAWVERWCVWYLSGRRGPRPLDAPLPMTRIGWQFATFTLWRLAGGLPEHRPPDLDAQIPAWAWPAFQRVRPWLTWPLPVLFCADPNEAAGCASRAAWAGFRSVALQLTTYTAADVAACQAADLRVMGWGIASQSDATYLATAGAVAYVPQIEGPGQRDSAVAMFAEGASGSRLRAIVTTFSGLEPPAQAARVATYISATMVECYVQDQPVGADLGRMTWQARQYGLPNPLPVVGLYDDVGTESYPQLAGYVPRFGVWRGLQMPERAWGQVRALVVGG